MHINFGEYLRKEREKKQITFEEIFERTKIKKEFIEAIELEEFSLLPSEPFAGGFIKNYAKCLSLNPEEAYDSYKRIIGMIDEKRDESFMFEVDNKSMKLNIIKKILWVLGVFFIVFCAGLIFYNVVVYASVVLGPKAKVSSFESFASVTDTPKIVPLEKFNIEIKCIDKCWVKLFSGNKVLFEGTMLVNQVKKFNTGNRIRIVVGNVYGLQMKINDVDMDVKRKSKGGINNIKITKDNFKDWRLEK